MNRRRAQLLLLVLACGCQVREPAAALYQPKEKQARIAAPADPIEKAPADRRFSVFAAGDVMMGKIAQSTIRDRGLDYPFAGVRDVIEKSDIAFANLEAPISSRGREKIKKMYRLRVHPAQARAITHSGIDVVSLANNHMMDFDVQALSDTIKHLDAWGIAHSGAGLDLEEARTPARFEVGGTEVVLLAYCAWSPAPIHARTDRPGVAPLEREVVLEDVRQHARDDNVVLVSLHWGVQHTDHATRGQVNLAHDIIDAGASAILGHHPHRPQEVEIYKRRPIIYSLGNFLFGFYNKIYRNNIAVVIEFDGPRATGVRILPVAGKNGQIRFQPRLLTGKKGLAVLRHVERISNRFGTRMTIEGGEARLQLLEGR